MFMLLTTVLLQSWAFGRGADLNFCTGMLALLASVTGKEGGLAMAAIEEWVPSSNPNTFNRTPHFAPNQCPMNPPPCLQSINAASSCAIRGP